MGFKLTYCHVSFRIEKALTWKEKEQKLVSQSKDITETLRYITLLMSSVR